MSSPGPGGREAASASTWWAHPGTEAKGGLAPTHGGEGAAGAQGVCLGVGCARRSGAGSGPCGASRPGALAAAALPNLPRTRTEQLHRYAHALSLAPADALAQRAAHQRAPAEGASGRQTGGGGIQWFTSGAVLLQDLRHAPPPPSLETSVRACSAAGGRQPPPPPLAQRALPPWCRAAGAAAAARGRDGGSGLLWPALAPRLSRRLAEAQRNATHPPGS